MYTFKQCIKCINGNGACKCRTYKSSESGEVMSNVKCQHIATNLSVRKQKNGRAGLSVHVCVSVVIIIMD